MAKNLEISVSADHPAIAYSEQSLDNWIAYFDGYLSNFTESEQEHQYYGICDCLMELIDKANRRGLISDDMAHDLRVYYDLTEWH